MVSQSLEELQGEEVGSMAFRCLEQGEVVEGVPVPGLVAQGSTGPDFGPAHGCSLESCPMTLKM